MSSIQDRLVATVSSSPGQRRDVDIELAIPWLRKKSELLQKLDKDILKDVIRNCGYQRATKDDVVIAQGAIGECFYIMLTGRMSVYIDTTRTDDEPSADVKEGDSGKQEKESGIPKDEDGSDSEKQNGRKKEFDRTQFGKFIMYFEAGNSFGEIALISDNCIRNASIISDMESDLLIIHKDLFNTYIKASQVAEYEERRDFVNGCKLFSGWSSKFKGLLEMSLRKELHPYGSTIIQQGASVEGLVFITSGQAKLAMDPVRHESQYEHILKRRDPFYMKSNKDKRDKGEDHHSHAHKKVPVKSRQVQVRRKFGYAAAERRIMAKSTDVCCIGKDEVIGSIEMVMDLETNMETVISTASTTVFVLNSKNYDRLIAKKHPFTITRLVQLAYNTVSARSKSVKGIHIPLFRTLEIHLKEKLPKAPLPAKSVEIMKKKEVVMQQLLQMFLRDKVPFIEPFVPNSLYYRIKSDQKTKALMENPYAKLRSLKQIEDYGKIRRKVPRSIKQLKNNITAERELLGDNRRAVGDAYDVFQNDGRPNTSVGFATSRSSIQRSPRPKSAFAHSLKITECEEELYSFESAARHPDYDNKLDEETMAEIFEEMEMVSRENQDNRMRLICSATAKRDLKQTLSRSGSSSRLPVSIDQLYDTEYFDWETSETNLTDLESRVQEFCHTVAPRRPSRTLISRRPSSAASAIGCGSQSVTKMKRFAIDDPSSVPLSGGTVFVHTKPCRFPHTTHTSPGVHRHVRRFILSKEPVWLTSPHTRSANNNV